MLVVADSSPMVALVNIEQIGVLPALFESVSIPRAVAFELAGPRRPQAVRDFIQSPPHWLSIRDAARVEPIANLHVGEVEAISLAKELKADLPLIDEREGRQAALKRSIPITGTVGVLELAARRKLIDLSVVFERLKRTDFWVSPAFLDARLRAFNDLESGV